jgi:hypothetical protein
VTEQGTATLEALTAGLKQTHAALHMFLDRYARLVEADACNRQKEGAHDPRVVPRGRLDGVRAPRGPDGQPVGGGA